MLGGHWSLIAGPMVWNCLIVWNSLPVALYDPVFDSYVLTIFPSIGVCSALEVFTFVCYIFTFYFNYLLTLSFAVQVVATSTQKAQIAV